ncbi:transmembrane protease serine 9-like [Notolabrus celidotus]|uniref:transmembrane protease serine 9-like n=1 Tax=Notolabrus celidotus TaxID=1203425 RepID=UPI0014907FB7|nr:transmembrane protease serine 9-like [Notolabrus celidotus]
MGGMTRQLLLLWAGITVSRSVDLQKRIVRGQPCGSGERQYHVKLIGNNGTNNFLCGGSLISDRWILTAAHCKQRNMTAYVGVHPPPGKPEIITAPPEIFRDNNHRGHDIMLLRLPNPTHFPNVKLPDCNKRPHVGAMVQIAGHASTTLGPNNKRRNDRPADLQCADIGVIDRQNCRKCLQKNDPQFYQLHEYQHWFCGQSARVDISLGDSGGGVVYNHMIYGVVSFTGNGLTACHAPAAFMDVCEYMPWINGIINRPLPKAILDVHPGPGRSVYITSLPKTYKEKVNFIISKNHDIMLLKLRKAVAIKPVDLPTVEECNARKNILSFQIAGHSSTTMGPNKERGEEESNTLQCADIGVIDCKNFLNCLKTNQPDFYKKHSFQHLLCGQSSVADASPGDSGGGVVHNGKLYGVITFGGSGTHACVSPIAYMDVCEYLPWIKETAGIP